MRNIAPVIILPVGGERWTRGCVTRLIIATVGVTFTFRELADCLYSEDYYVRRDNRRCPLAIIPPLHVTVGAALPQTLAG